jgi:hypothetical protein
VEGRERERERERGREREGERGREGGQIRTGKGKENIEFKQELAGFPLLSNSGSAILQNAKKDG